MKGALAIASTVKSGEISAANIVERCLTGLEAANASLNALTRTLADRARREAALVDGAVAAGRDPGPLAGVADSRQPRASIFFKAARSACGLISAIGRLPSAGRRRSRNQRAFLVVASA